ncbi:MAG TPA: recombinase family protein [Ruminococcaceae bacterium]|nr:recombinase family protein [Oscillospiraceae bacterium]
MDVHTVRRQMRTKSIYDIPLRVTFYARVSSEKDEQLNSLDNQISYYRNFIKKNANWEFVDGYIDEGLSGMSTKKRENFHNMVNDAKSGLFDLVITKEITRFARNTLDSIQYTRELLSCGVGVFFQNDNINTLDEDSELRLTIMSGIAQDELRKLSSRIKFGHQEAIKKSVVLGNSRIFGYRKDNKRLVIDEKEAEMVRELFTLYATDKYSMKQLEDIFWSKGYRNNNGKKICHSTMSNTISNPKYKGYYVGNKVKIVDMFTKKQKFLPPEEWVMFKDETGEIVPAIVSEELWEQANAVLKRRSRDVKNRQNQCNHANLLTGKMYCTHCGRLYYRKDSKDRKGNMLSRWICSGKIANGAASCPSFTIYEEEIKEVLYDVFKDTAEDAKRIIEEYTSLYAEMTEKNASSADLKRLKDRLDLLSRKKSKLLEYNIAGQISDRDFIEMNRQITKESSEVYSAIEETENEINSQAGFKEKIEEIKTVLQKAEKDASKEMIDSAFVNKYIDKIYVTPVDDGVIDISVKLFTGDTFAKVFEKSGHRLAGRTGHTFKKMIESYENSMK